jgi:hypothetical protein
MGCGGCQPAAAALCTVRLAMILEQLLSLPIGTRVFGEIELPTRLPGKVAALDDCSRFIRWDDGYSSIPFGKVREYDEYIAAHTELQPTRNLRVERRTKTA